MRLFHFIALLAITNLGFGQAKKNSEQHSFEGIVEKYKIGFGIAYNSLSIKSNENSFLIKFNSIQGKELITKFPIGTSVTGISRRSRTNLKTPANSRNKECNMGGCYQVHYRISNI